MSDSTEAKARELYEQALERPESARGKFLDRVCGGGELRARVEALLKAHKNVGEFLAQPTGGSGAHASVREQAGDVIGRYKLLQEIGEGGFGVVYMAQQQEPVRRKVALKIIKMGMDTEQVIARFEAERQALAIMDHANIAKVLDAGATETGRPYFVMELVRGIPITQYCDQVKLPAADRIALFQDVCHAVQHAHHKGIIHRDIKPSNILVTLHDDRPVPKVIDFGIAKATDHQLTQKTVFTQFRQMIGTPEYMAPEQAGISGLDVDTRADVYSLGVVLYELLTGSKPFDLATLLEQGYDEVLRTIREVEPQKPSTRSEQLDAVAQHRHVPARFLRGDLDWIVLKALEKDRMRRYETPDALAMDLQRFLRDEPVLATPPSAGYRFRKYVKRHRAGVVMAAAVFLALIAGGALAFAGYLEATRQAEDAEVARGAEARARARAETSAAEAKREAAAAEKARTAEAEQRSLAEKSARNARDQAARANTVVRMIEGMFTAADPWLRGPDYPVRRLLDDFERDLEGQLEDQPEVEASIRRTIARAYNSLGLPQTAEQHARRALELYRRVHGPSHVEVASSLSLLASMLGNQGKLGAAADLHRRAFEMAREHAGDSAPATLAIRRSQSIVAHDRGDYREAVRLARAVLAAQRTTLGNRHHEVATTLKVLGSFLGSLAEYEAAERCLEEAMEIRRDIYGESHPSLATCLQELGGLYSDRGKLAEAERLGTKALEIVRASSGEEHPEFAKYLHNLAVLQKDRGALDRAVAGYQKSMAIIRKTLGPDSPWIAANLVGLARVRKTQGRHTEAVTLAREALARYRKVRGNDHRNTAGTLLTLGDLLEQRAEYGAAADCFEEAIGIYRRTLGEKHPELAEAFAQLGSLNRKRGRIREAEKLLREAIRLLRESVGDSHDSLINALAGLGAVLADRGADEEAEACCRKAVALARACYGDKHVQVAAYLSNLSCLLTDPGEFKEAETLLREALAIENTSLGDGHYRSSTTLGNLAGLRLRMGDVEEARSLVRRAVDARFKHSEEVNPKSIRWLGELSLSLHQADGLKGAAVAAQREFEASRERHGVTHPLYAAHAMILAGLLRDQGDTANALVRFREAREIFSETYGAGHPLVADCLEGMAFSYRLRRERGKELELQQRAFEIRRATLGSAHPLTVRSACSVANSLARAGRGKEAESLLKEALATVRKTVGEGHSSAALPLTNLAEVLYARGDLARAEALLRKGLAVIDPGHKKPRCSSLNLLGVILIQKGDLAGAVKHLREASELGYEMRRAGAFVEGFRTVLLNLGAALHRVRDLDGAKRALQDAREAGKGTRDSITVRITHMLAVVLGDRGEYEAAAERFREAIALGHELPDVAKEQIAACLQNLVFVLCMSGDYAGAEEACGKLSPQQRTHSTLALLGVCLMKRGAHVEAERALRKCLAIRSKQIPGTWLHFAAMSLLGESLAGQGKYANAEPLLLEGYAKMRPPAYAAKTRRDAGARLVKLYEAWGKPEKAAAWKARLESQAAK